MALKRLALLAFTVGAAGCRTSSAPVPASAKTNAYVLRLGKDTLAVDQATRLGDRIEGTMVTHLPRTQVTRYTVVLNPSTGLAHSLEYSVRLPDGGMLPAGNQPGSLRKVTITFDGDSAVRRDQRDSVITTRAAVRNGVPFITYAIAFFQLPIGALRASKADSATYAIYQAGRQTTPLSVVRKVGGGNRYVVSIGGFPWDVVTDNRGVVQSVDGARTTQHYATTRQGSVDGPALAAMWVQRERDARVPAVLSIRDTARANIGTAELWVDYGRPALRGRKVFGSTGVLNDTIWRTGANAATQFRTNVPVTLAGVPVPAGTYTLWTVAVPGRYQLIVNKQTGQWGTVYDPKQDLVRVPLQTRSLSQPVEQFTIAIETIAPTGVMLRLRWDTTELSVPITVP